MEKNKLLVVSLDAISSDDLQLLLTLPTFKKLASTSSLVKEVNSIYPSNTYPIHTSIISGVYPQQHGIIDNTYFDYGNSQPLWRWYYHLIKANNVVEQACKQNYKIASIFWPVMAKAPIKYNIPEIIARDHENQIAVVLKNSTRLFAVKAFLKYGRKVNGSQQPQLDDFSTNVACDLLTKNNTDLVLLHLTDVDTTKHQYGIKALETIAALKRMDERLAKLWAAASTNYQILIVSDHAQLDAEQHCDLNSINSFPNVWWHLSEGFAVLLEKEPLALIEFTKLKEWVEKQACFHRFLSKDEFETSGFKQYSRLAFTVKQGWAVSSTTSNHIGNHGYTLDYPHYKVFYLAHSEKLKTGFTITGGSILDICPLMTQLLALPAFTNQGKLRVELLKK